jgi:hypothetical protein
MILEDIEKFKSVYITREVVKDWIPAFDIGTYFHTAILEPHLLQKDCVVFKGIRRGKVWDKFKEDHKGKAIITSGEMDQAERLISGVKESEVAMGLIDSSKVEVSAFIDVGIKGNEVYARNGTQILTPTGWEGATESVEEFDATITLKVRADALGDDFILDLKSCSGNVKADWQMMNKVSEQNYDLSAALYLDVFSQVKNEKMDKFYWVFSSKDSGRSQTWLASEDSIKIGRAKWKKALLKLVDAIENNWEFEDVVLTLGPNMFEYRHLKEPVTRNNKLKYSKYF